MNASDIDEGTFYVTTKLRDDLYVFGAEYEKILLEVWRDEKTGLLARHAELPPVIAYDYGSFEKLYEAWPNPDGTFTSHNRIDEPCEIYYNQGNPRMVWYDADGKVSHVKKIDECGRFLHSGDVTSAFLTALAGFSSVLETEAPITEPSSYDLNVPSIMEWVRNL